MANWPSTLPQEPIKEGYTETAPNTLIRTNMDAGPAKIRRRYTAGVRTFNMDLFLTTAQVEILDIFYMTTTKGGSEQWTWKNPRTAAVANFRFVSEPTYKHEPYKDYYKVSLHLEQLP